MSLYSELELSIFGGRPVELYKFTHAAEVWTYSSVSEDVVYNTETYSRLAIRRSSIGQGSEIAKADMTISCPLSCEISQLFLNGSPEEVVTLTIFRNHVNSDDGPVVVWKGRVILAKWNGSTCKLTCQSIYSLQKRAGLRRRYTRGCQHVLYGRGCRIEDTEGVSPMDKENFMVPGVVTAIGDAAMTLTVSGIDAYLAGEFIAGMVATTTDDVTAVFRFITDQAENILTVSTPLLAIAVDDPVYLYLGCSHDLTACNEKFNNLPNYGGFPWMPFENPFEGSII